MPTSGVANFNPDILDLIEEAYELVGIEVRGGYDLRSARRSLDMLMREWGNRGLNLWTIKEFLIPVTAPNRDITLPIDTIDLLDCFWRTGSASNPQDSVLSRLSTSQFANLANKGQKGNPSQFYVHRTQPPVARIWPAPTSDGIFGGWGLRVIENTGAYTNTMDVPQRFLPALTTGLAYFLAIKSPNAVDRVPFLQQEYERQFGLAAEEDRDRASFFMVPDLSSYNR